MIEIETRHGKQSIKANVRGGLAIHKSLNGNGYVLTHELSGYIIQSALKYREAFRLRGIMFAQPWIIQFVNSPADKALDVWKQNVGERRPREVFNLEA